MFLFILFLYIIQYVSCNVSVKTNVGIIEGVEATNGNYTMFMGIPYATIDPANPFGEAIPFPKFKNGFQAFNDSAVCPQRVEYTNRISGDVENCLHVNIYVPKTASRLNKLPVLVSIHGGRFVFGFAGRYQFGPKYLVSHDIILITLNNRLGIYGFMCLDIPEVSGNQGLKDQQVALEWIYNNIEYFGGDNKLITIFGQSSGSMSIDLHLQSPYDKLYSKVIFQGGTSLVPGMVADGDATVPLRIAEYLGFITTDVRKALTFLYGVDTVSLVEATEKLNIILWPCVEKDFGQTRFISDYPINQNVTKVKGVDVLMGNTDMEALIDIRQLSPQDFYSWTPFDILLNTAFNFEAERLTEMKRIVRQFYIGDKVITPELWRELTYFYSDLELGYPTIRTMKKLEDGGSRNIFLYIFSYTGHRNYVKIKQNITYSGAAHNDDIGYLFDVSFFPDYITVEDQLTIDRMTTMFSNFVKYGNPTPNTTDLIPVTWLPATSKLMHYLNIDSNLTTGMRPFHDRYAFWELFYMLNKEYEKGYRANSAHQIASNILTSCVVVVIYLFVY